MVSSCEFKESTRGISSVTKCISPLHLNIQLKDHTREKCLRNSDQAKEFEEAFRCYTCSLALDDENERVHNNRAAAAHKLERFELAEDDCTRCSPNAD